MSRRNLEDWFWQVGGDVLVVERVAPKGRSLRRKFWEPKADLFEDDRHFILRCELAGVRPEEIQIAYLPDRHAMYIAGTRHDEELPGAEKKGCHHLEIYFGEFERLVPLPDTPIVAEGVRAHYRTGILHVLVPKSRVRVRHVRMTITEA